MKQPSKHATSKPPTPASLALRVLHGLSIGLPALLLIALLYQGIATAVDARRYPPPGELILVGEHHLHLFCQGEGRPTVVLEAGLGGNITNWTWIQPQVAELTRVCAYDRAGLGWSDAGQEALNAQNVSHDLHALLEAAGETGPYLLVGHSLGGLYNRMFAHSYPEDVAGMVLVDARHPEIPERFEPYEENVTATLRMLNVARALAPFGVLRLLGDMGGTFAHLPDEARAAALALTATPKHLRTYLAELEAMATSDALVKETAAFGSLPLMVLAAGEPQGDYTEDFWELLQTMQGELAELSTDARYTVISEADHISIVANPEHASRVAEAITSLVTELQAQQQNAGF